MGVIREHQGSGYRRWYGRSTHIFELNIAKLCQLGDCSMSRFRGHVELHQAHRRRAVEGLIVDPDHV